MDRIRFVLINPASPTWRVEPGERPRQARYFRFSMLSSQYVAAAMPANVDTRIIDECSPAVDAMTSPFATISACTNAG